MYTSAPPLQAPTASSTTTMTGSQALRLVDTRHTLSQTSSTVPHTSSGLPRHAEVANASKNKVDWPPAVRQYVQRCFVLENKIKGISKEDLEAKLKSVITQAAESNNLNSVDWASLPLPQQMLQEERTRALLSSPFVGNLRSPIPAPPHDFVQVSRPKSEALKKKRKSAELSKKSEELDERPSGQQSAPIGFEDRVSFAPAPSEKRQRLDHHPKNASKSQPNLDHRKKRFENSRLGNYSPSKANAPSETVDTGPVIGRSENLEKNYFRLTAPPNPDTVRPLHILQKTLELLKRKWKQHANYTYICDQFKSLRQDLTVQHIKNDFTVNVYEIHARIALEKGDLGEYNQCQTQLRALYRQNLGGHPMEFKAYRILYFIHTCNRTDMNDVLSELTPADKAEKAVKHALDVRSALALGNYHRFFQLFLETPNMGAYLMDMFVARERLVALACICKTYKSDVTIRYVTEELGFESDEDSARFILEYASEDLLQERDVGVRLLTSKAGQTFEEAKREAFKLIDLKGQI